MVPKLERSGKDRREGWGRLDEECPAHGKMSMCLEALGDEFRVLTKSQGELVLKLEVLVTKIEGNTRSAQEMDAERERNEGKWRWVIGLVWGMTMLVFGYTLTQTMEKFEQVTINTAKIDELEKDVRTLRAVCGKEGMWP